MKIALLSTNYDLGGAAVVTARLCDALCALGHDARMVVARPGALRDGKKNGGTPAEVMGKLRWGSAFLAERAELFLKGVSRKNLFKVSTGRFGASLARHPFVREADAVMVNWASQGFLSLDDFEAILDTGRPVIYTMHDLWAATALCHIPGDCDRYADGSDCRECPYVQGRAGRGLPREIWDRKRRIFSHPNLRIVAVSTDQARRASISPLLAGKDIEVIPHPFPAELYTVGEKLSPEGKRLIVMAAARLDDPVKDLPAAVEALNIFAEENSALASGVEVSFVGELRDSTLLAPLTLPHSHLGLLSPASLRDLYSRTAVIISSSRYETLGATLIEGMASGATPVSFPEGGRSDIITDSVTGYLATPHTPASLAASLTRALTAPIYPSILRSSVESRFSASAVARRYLSLL